MIYDFAVPGNDFVLMLVESGFWDFGFNLLDLENCLVLCCVNLIDSWSVEFRSRRLIALCCVQLTLKYELSRLKL